MRPGISHSRKDESFDAKAKWFQSLSIEERMELLCSFTDLLLELNPEIVGKKDAQPVKGNIRVLSKP
jgi:hypothetical protein